MADITVASVQFENATGDKKTKLQRIDSLTFEAASKGAKVVVFHECSISSYTFAQRLSREELHEVAEPVSTGPSCQELTRTAKRHNAAVLDGLFERDEEDNLYNTYVYATGDGIVAKFRKIHPFINSSLSPGNEYVVFDLFGWKCGILICYDNNVVENVRATALLGAEIIFMPHVTMCTPSSRPGAGFVDPQLWQNRFIDQTSLSAEFDGLKEGSG